MLRALAPLQNLRRLAFTGDSYDSPHTTSLIDYYYTFRTFDENMNDQDSEDPDKDQDTDINHISTHVANSGTTTIEAGDEVVDDAGQPVTEYKRRLNKMWERWYANRMLEHGRRYFKELNNLDSFFCGQILMETNDAKRPAITQVSSRDTSEHRLDFRGDVFGCRVLDGR